MEFLQCLFVGLRFFTIRERAQLLPCRPRRHLFQSIYRRLHEVQFVSDPVIAENG